MNVQMTGLFFNLLRVNWAINPLQVTQHLYDPFYFIHKFRLVMFLGGDTESEGSVQTGRERWWVALPTCF